MAKNNNNRQKSSSLIQLLLVLSLSIIGAVSAKYIYSMQVEKALRAKEFYFKSNLLTETGKEYRINSDSAAVSFKLQNHIDDLRFSEDIVEYTVTVTTKDGGSIGNTSLSVTEYSNTPEISTSTTVKGQMKNGEIDNITIKLSDIEEGKAYVVTATGISKDEKGNEGYKQTLIAEFQLASDDEKVYKYLSNDSVYDAFVLLTVWSTNCIGDLNISYLDSDLIPDNTNPVMADVNTISGSQSITFNDETNFKKPYSSYTYRFFKESIAGEIDINKFTVLLNGNLAEPNTPQ